MKKTLFIIFYLIILSFQGSVAQQGQQNKSIPSEEKSQIILDKNIVILVSPSEEIINKLKTEMGDDFYIMADDVNYYRSLAYDYLTSINQAYLTKQDNVAIFYPQKDGKLHEIHNDDSNLHWWALLYKHNERKYKIIGLINFKDEYEKFMSIKDTYPKDVEFFINDRKEWEHFLKEISGDLTINNTKNLNIQFDKYCKGTDKVLEELKTKYKDNPNISKKLSQYEENIETYK